MSIYALRIMNIPRRRWTYSINNAQCQRHGLCNNLLRTVDIGHCLLLFMVYATGILIISQSQERKNHSKALYFPADLRIIQKRVAVKHDGFSYLKNNNGINDDTARYSSSKKIRRCFSFTKKQINYFLKIPLTNVKIVMIEAIKVITVTTSIFNSIPSSQICLCTSSRTALFVQRNRHYHLGNSRYIITHKKNIYNIIQKCVL